MGIYGTPGGYPGLQSYMPQLPQSSDPYGLAGAMAFSNMMAQNAQVSGGLRNSLGSIQGGGGGGPVPNLAQWMGPHINAYQQSDPFYSDIMSTGQRGIDLAGQGQGQGLLAGAIKAQAQNEQYGNYQAYTDQMQQLAFQQALAQQKAQQDFSMQMADALTQSAEKGIPAGMARQQMDALISAGGPQIQGAQQGLYGAFNQLYPGGAQGTGGRVSPLASLTLLDPQQNPQLPVLVQAVIQEAQAGHDPQTAYQNILQQAGTDQALAQALSTNQATLPLVIQQMYGQQAQANPAQAQSGVNTSAQPQQTGDAPVSDWDKTFGSLESGLKWGGIGAGVGSALGPPGAIVGGALGAAGGLLAGLLGHGHHETNPAMGLLGAAGQGALGGTIGRLGFGGGLPSMLGGRALSGVLENRLASEAAPGFGGMLLNKGIAGLSDTATSGRINPFLPGMPFGSMLRGGLENTLGRTPWATGAAGAAEGAMGGISPMLGGNPFGPPNAGLEAMQMASRSGVPGVATAGAPLIPPGVPSGMPGGLPGLAFASQEYAPPLLGLQQMIQATGSASPEQLMLSQVTPEMWQQLFQNLMARGGMPG